MTQTIRATYRVNAETMAILSAENGSYIYEREQEIFQCQERPLQIIRKSCLDGGASFAGRIDAVRHKTKLSKKLPIPINVSENWYAFPTAGLRDYDCYWIFYHHIDKIEATNRKCCNIYFHDQQWLPVKKSLYTLRTQMQRTGWVMSLFLTS
ncbi:competence protein ComK [Natribacillus halophilus]|uniref:Competence protein ComK n=1 Tax=Natribacillus halophilus TaxID=549003 RepID=A0A1G8KNQ9_9BACI|nr:competence protein ComK [Natribacillus halophilus]SDI45009.1 competence protein ComK [Natribacillus halophilus]